jgi:hypothetical protein
LVYDENMKFICTAEDLEFMGQDRHKIKQSKKKSLALMRQLDKIVKEAVETKDTTIMDRIEAVRDVIDTPTIAVTKHTKMVDALLESSPIIEAKDKEKLEQSNRYDFKNKDEEGKPTKVLASGRPAFESMFDRFVWVLENNAWNEKDEKLKAKNNDIYEMAKRDVDSRKVG